MIAATLTGPLICFVVADPSPQLVWLGYTMLIVFVAATLWLYTGTRPWPTLKRLRQRLPWFEIQHVNRFDATREPGLARVLEQSGFVVHEIDGRVLDGWPAVADALGKVLDRRYWPEDARENALATILRAHTEGARNKAVVIRNASHFATAAPGVLVEFVADVAQIQPNHVRCVLLFLDLPDEVPPRTPEATADVARQGAPHPWWRPQHGELTR